MPPLPPPAGASLFGEFLTSDNNLSLILRRLDEIERKLDRMLEELRTPTARQTSPTAVPSSPCRRIKAICASLKFDLFKILPRPNGPNHTCR
jgi:hypothetical protein